MIPHAVVVGQPVLAEPATSTKPVAASKPVVAGEPVAAGKPVAKSVPLPTGGWTHGLMHEMAKSVDSFPIRYVIVDNSASMNLSDGRRLVANKDGHLRPITCTRWAELGESILELANVTAALNAETHYHLLNPCVEGQFFVLNAQDASTARASMPSDITQLKRVMKSPCEYSTPLTEAVEKIAKCIAPSEAALRAAGKRAIVIVATDGLPNDANSFVRAMINLQRLPVWVVVRLCTNDDNVVDYWTALDKQLEMPLEVLDDVAGEAKEAHRYNPWLICPPELHLARTMGVKDKLYDLLDEQPLAPSQVKEFIERLLGDGGESSLAEPELELDLFLQQVGRLAASSPSVYNPMTKAMGPWIDVRALRRFLNRRLHKGGAAAQLCISASEEVTHFCTIS